MNILEALLNKVHRQHGLQLCQDEDFLYLVKNGHTVAVFSAKGATVAEIQKEADKYLTVEAMTKPGNYGGISIEKLINDL